MEEGRPFYSQMADLWIGATPSLSEIVEKLNMQDKNNSAASYDLIAFAFFNRVGKQLAESTSTFCGTVVYLVPSVPRLSPSFGM